ncbi:hypothetical protein ES705_29728 [subsurface metagenome]
MVKMINPVKPTVIEIKKVWFASCIMRFMGTTIPTDQGELVLPMLRGAKDT